MVWILWTVRSTERSSERSRCQHGLFLDFTVFPGQKDRPRLPSSCWASDGPTAAHDRMRETVIGRDVEVTVKRCDSARCVLLSTNNVMLRWSLP